MTYVCILIWLIIVTSGGEITGFWIGISERGTSTFYFIQLYIFGIIFLTSTCPIFYFNSKAKEKIKRISSCVCS